MINRRPAKSSPAKGTHAVPTFHEWVLSLPWVVERPPVGGAAQVRTFAVECEPLDRRRLWLVTDLRQSCRFDGGDMAVIVPLEVAQFIEHVGWGQSLSPMPARHVLVAASERAIARPQDLEAFVLTAYSYAMSED